MSSSRRRQWDTDETDQLLAAAHNGGSNGISHENGTHAPTHIHTNGSRSAPVEYDGVRNAQLSTLYFLCSKDPEEEPFMWNQVRQWFIDHSQQDITDAAILQGSYGITALHLVCRNDGPIDIVNTLVSSAPSALEMLDTHGWLPLHYAAANGASDAMIKLLVDTFPAAVDVGDKQGRVPLHFALSSHAEDLSVECAKALASPESTSCKDENEMTAM